MPRAVEASLFLVCMFGFHVAHAQSQTAAGPVAAPPAAKQDAQPPSDYILGPGDVLSVTIYGDNDLTRDVPVGGDGYVWLPLLKEGIKAAGLTAVQLQNQIAERYIAQKILNAPHPLVIVREYKGAPVVLAGEFAKTGVIQLTGRTTLLQAVSMGQSLGSKAGPNIVVARKISSDGSGPPRTENFTIPIRELVEHPEDPRLNIELKGGDVVSIPSAEYIYVGGAVTGPKALSTHEDSWTVLRALMAAGNPSRSAKLSKAVILRKSPDGTTKQIPVDLKKVMDRKTPDMPLQANDILLVPDSSGRHALNKALDSLAGLASSAIVVTMARP